MSNPAITKKVCVIGAFAVGKTSLISRFVHSIFSEKYHTTIGVKVDKKQIDLDGRQVTMMLWDLAGEDEFQKLRLSYLNGASGYLLVIDRTRRATLEVGLDLQTRVADVLGSLPFVVIVNKSDLADRAEITDADLDALRARGWAVLTGSAKTGENVELAFVELARGVTGASHG